jgi:hypothetical protein
MRGRSPRSNIRAKREARATGFAQRTNRRSPRRPHRPELDASGRIHPLPPLFGFAQFDFAGALPLADGRYLARDEAGERVLVVRTLGAPLPPRRRRRKPRDADPDATLSSLPLTRVTAVRAFAPIEAEVEAAGWLAEALATEEAADALLVEGMALLNRALHARAVAAADPFGRELAAEDAVAARLGYGSGAEAAAGEFTVAREIDARAGGASLRRRREEDLRPQERMAAVLRGKERLDACEPLLLRARADLDAGRSREAALQLRVGLEALLAELDGAATDSGHKEDMATLRDRRGEAGEAANAALKGDLSPAAVERVRELLELCERVLRRRRVLRG